MQRTGSSSFASTAHHEAWPSWSRPRISTRSSAGLAGGTPLVVPIALGVGWSNRTGFSFTGGAGIVVPIYPHLELGPLTIDRVDLAVGSDFGGGKPPALRTSAAITFTGAVGPVVVAVEGIGLALDLVFADGNVGPFDVRLDFVPPTALGLAIDAGPISGGGFLGYDKANARYSGILHLEVFSIAVTAIGLLTTRDANGQDLPPPGFSFLIIIAVEFPPIQLGYGFTLNGVGGLAGLHRTIVVEALQTGLRAGSVDHVLFPRIRSGTRRRSSTTCSSSSRRRPTATCSAPWPSSAGARPPSFASSSGSSSSCPRRSGSCCSGRSASRCRPRTCPSSRCTSTSSASSTSTSSWSRSTRRCATRRWPASPSAATWRCGSRTATTRASRSPSAASTRTSSRRRASPPSSGSPSLSAPATTRASRSRPTWR